LATYHASDPSLNTATGSATARNWVGLFGAYLSDVLLQTLGLTAFLLPVWMGGVAWTWLQSRPGGSPILRWMGTVFALVFLPTVFGLLPWHWRWLHMVPVEGVVGRLVAGVLVVYLNIQGAWLVAAAFAVCGLYFASAISFWVIRESFAERWAQFCSLRDRWRERRDARAEQRAESETLGVERNAPVPFPKLVTADGPAEEPEPTAGRLSRFFSFFKRRRAPQQDQLDEIPAYQRKEMPQELDEPAEEAIPITQRRPSIWERKLSEPAMAAQPPAAAPALSVASRETGAGSGFAGTSREHNSHS
jgi:S-DNA-T family DNA segregation ATPase FtsK/SpoIIIE